MKVSLKYNSKSSGQYVPQANKLSESLEYEQEGKHYIVRFDDIDDPKLEKLYSYVRTLKGTAILLGNEEEISARDFFNVVKCESKLLCDGICKHGRIGNRSIDNFLLRHSQNIGDNVLQVTGTYVIQELSDFLTKKTETEFQLNKELLWQYLQKELDYEREFCEKFDMEKIEQTVHALPDEVHIIQAEDMYPKEREMREYRDVTRIIRDLLSSAAISSQLSFDALLDCAKTVSIVLSKFSLGNQIQDSQILISYHPDEHVFTLIRFIFSEQQEEIMSEEFTEDQQLVITKEKEFFTINSPFGKLLFQAYSEEDSNLEKYFHLIKSA